MKSGGRSSVLSVHLLPVAVFVHRAEPHASLIMTISGCAGGFFVSALLWSC